MGTAVMTGKDFLVLTREGSGQTFEVHPGFVLYVVFEENPTTGMIWTRSSSNSAIVPDYDAYTPGERRGMVGVPGAHLFAFKVVHDSGQAYQETLAFALGRPGEKNPYDEARFEIRIAP